MKTDAKGKVRAYADGLGERPYSDHIGGVVRNNVIFNRKGVHLESGIELMNVLGTRVEHNTVVSHDPPFSSIEYRWPDTRVEVVNNVVSHRIRGRNQAQGLLKRNLESAPPEWFVDHSGGDLRPKASSAPLQGCEGRIGNLQLELKQSGTSALGKD